MFSLNKNCTEITGKFYQGKKGAVGKCLNMVHKGYTLFGWSLVKSSFTLNLAL